MKPIHARAYTVPRSVEQQSQSSKEIVRLVPLNGLPYFHHLQFLRKMEQ
jgi:hypothetical protein